MGSAVMHASSDGMRSMLAATPTAYVRLFVWLDTHGPRMWGQHTTDQSTAGVAAWKEHRALGSSLRTILGRAVPSTYDRITGTNRRLCACKRKLRSHLCRINISGTISSHSVKASVLLRRSIAIPFARQQPLDLPPRGCVPGRHSEVHLEDLRQLRRHLLVHEHEQVHPLLGQRHPRLIYRKPQDEERLVCTAGGQ